MQEIKDLAKMIYDIADLSLTMENETPESFEDIIKIAKEIIEKASPPF